MPQGEGVRVGSVSKKSCSARAKRSQGMHKCHPLEPVLEHSVAYVEEAPRKEQPQYECGKDGEKRFKGKSILVRLRDGYVRMMNDMASSADLSGVSAMYGCSSSQVDYPGVAAMASKRRAKEEEDLWVAQETVDASGPGPRKM